MGCQTSAQTPHLPERSEELGSDEIVRTVSQAATPVRVSSRHLTREALQDQRMRATVSLHDLPIREKSGHVALDRKGTITERRCTRMSSRISHLRTSERQAMVEGIKQVAETGSGDREGLEGRLDSFGMKMREMEGDGNCQFRSLAHNLFGTQEYHAVTRKAAVAHMRKHKDFFGQLFESAAEFKAYLQDMGKNRTWGDELTLRAVVEAYCCEAHVITSEQANWYLVYHPEGPKERDPKIAACPKGVQRPLPGKQVFLSYISPVHYNSVVVSKNRTK
mmetsp:Transcript_102079/g.319012  ORF Transcript_102079/g.319012 Transcript_102079/m.319012 type:complete len:277 (-) Transcript_102079:53-883(-)